VAEISIEGFEKISRAHRNFKQATVTQFLVDEAG
jgi:hypothetical protein